MIAESKPDPAAVVEHSTEVAGRVDRRRLRSARTRRAIIEAYLALLREGPTLPTSTRIAQRAGCSVRSIFERFPDLHALRVAATDYTFVEAATQVLSTESKGDRQARIRTHVESRARVCEHWLPLWRSLLVNHEDSPDLKSRVLVVREAIVKRIEMMYVAELGGLAARERQQVLIAIDSIIDFESWARMRQSNGLSFEDGCALWIYAIDRLLPAAPVS